MNIEIEKRFKSFHNKDHIRTFFTLLDRLIKHLGLDADDPRLALNVRNDAKKRISVNINSRLVLMLTSGKAENQIGFMIYTKDKAKLQGQFESLDLVGEEFEPRKDMDNAEIILLPANTAEDLIASVFQTSLNCVKDYLPKAAKSPYRSHHLQELFEMAIDPQMLEDELEQLDLTAQAINQLNEIMVKIQIQLSEENHPLVHHKWKLGRTARFRQISAFLDGNPLNKIQMHYEVRLVGKKVAAEFHQEGKPEEKRDFGNLVNTPAFESFQKAPWFTTGYPENKRIFVDEYPITDQPNLDDLAKQLSIDLKTLYNAIQPVLEINYSKSITPKKVNKPMSLNTILYGPPGTGKTYNTINKAISIIDSSFDFNQPRKAITDKYDELVKAGQIVFTTFHQSMSYEDFIEGIKPLPPDNNNDIQYDVQKGIFRELCEEAQKKNAHFIMVDGKKTALTKEIFEQIYNQIVETLPNQDQTNSTIKLETKEKYPFYLFRNKYSIVVKSGNMISNNSVPASQLKRMLFEGKDAIYQSYDPIILKWILEQHGYSKDENDNSDKRYVIIIDEINRGNVSQIFGELITLIEDDKRLDSPESIKITLPYSKKEFGVPPNIYIVGTMNTADRSVEALDTALRRRFTFEEKGPQSDLLKPSKLFWDLLWKYENKDWEDSEYSEKETELLNFLGASKEIWDKRKTTWDHWKKNKMNPEQAADFADVDFTGYRLDLMLEAINNRIEVLVDRDHQIGHAFFINVRTEPQLKYVFENKIIPLMQEYFFGDFGKIGLVLGPSFVEQSSLGNKGLFSVKGYDADLKNEYESRTTFRLTNPLGWNLRAIYEGVIQETASVSIQ